ncbi:MAG: hypothetical protein KatS3mg072_0263 [Meiothermus sp.]|nr:MAG: hypothetical protein KatS3mg072_0263 [Meiothermus sp.]
MLPMFPSRAVGSIRIFATWRCRGGFEEAYQKAVLCKVKYLQSKGIEPHPRTLAAYKAIMEQRGEDC